MLLENVLIASIPIPSEPWHILKWLGKEYEKLKQNQLPSVSYRYYASSVLSYLLEDRLREIKMLKGRVAPATCIIWEGIVWWTEIGGSDHNCVWKAPPLVIDTLDLKASPTAQTIVEQGRAQSSRVSSVALAIQVSISTSSTCNKAPNEGFVVILRSSFSLEVTPFLHGTGLHVCGPMQRDNRGNWDKKCWG